MPFESIAYPRPESPTTVCYLSMEKRIDQKLHGRSGEGKAEIHDFTPSNARTYRSAKTGRGVSLAHAWKLHTILTHCCHRLHITFIDKDGEKHTFEVAKGDNLLDIAQANDIEMEGELLKF